MTDPMRKEFFDCLAVLARAAEVPCLEREALETLAYCCGEMQALQAEAERRACWAEFWRDVTRDWPVVTFVAEPGGE